MAKNSSLVSLVCTGAMTLLLGGIFLPTLQAEVGKPQELAPGVWFHEGDLARRSHCNNGWIVFQDYVLVIDANFPSGAEDILPKIRAITTLPIRFAFDTHAHGDHAYGNRTFVEAGATIVAHAGVLEEMKRFETGFFGDKPGRWEDLAKNRPDVAKSKLSPPTLIFTRDLRFEDRGHLVELRHFGVAHTRGDGFAWLPKERILFTGDACVNGPYNYMGDGNSTEWLKTLEAARALKPLKVCPGHGLIGGPEVLDQQIEFFTTLRDEVKRRIDDGKKPAEIREAIPTIKALIQKNAKIANYVGGMFTGQVEKVYLDLVGEPLTAAYLPTASELRTLAATRSSTTPDRFAGFSDRKSSSVDSLKR
jgi:glyoxylase-like metal-dependent hydrolase (beta-lactamase superfamily II)